MSIERRPGWLRCCLLVVLALFSAGCAPRPLVDSAQSLVDTSLGGEAIGQTLVAEHAGLAGIDVYLLPAHTETFTATLHLRADPASAEDLRTTTLVVPAGADPDFYRFSFAPLADSNQRHYYAFWEATPAASFTVGAAGRQSYLDGGLYQDHKPVAFQGAFHLVYAPWFIALDLAAAGLLIAAMLGLALLAFGIPGYALLTLSGARDLDWMTRFSAACAIGLSYYAVLLVWAQAIGLTLGPWLVWSSVALGLGLGLWRWLSRARRRDADPDGAARPPRSSDWRRRGELWSSLAFVLVVAVVFSLRLLVVRGLDTPLWHDSVQHTVMAQLIADHGGLFESWLPYAPYASLTTHFGFSAAVAAFMWMSRLGSPAATLIVGQILNGLAVLALYPLAVRIAGGRRWAGIFAMVVAGLILQHPAFYVNWGRYAQLTGQVILPVALWLLWLVADADRFAWRLALLAALTACGMTLAYYRMPFYYVTFLGAWFLLWVLPTWGRSPRRWRRGSGLLLVTGVACLVLFAPWLGHLLNSVLIGQVTTQYPPDAESASSFDRAWLVAHIQEEYRAWLAVAYYIPQYLLALTFAAIGWALVRLQTRVLIVPLWTAALAALLAGALIGIPGANLMQTFAILIMLYIPVGLLTGWLLAEFEYSVEIRLPRAGPPIFFAAVMLIVLLTAPGQIVIVQPDSVLVTRPDENAMAWMRRNLPPDALILVEGYTTDNGTQAVGADAGWWIPLLAGRANTMPPDYAMQLEQAIEPGYTGRVVNLVKTAEEYGAGAPETLRLLCAWDITHAYVGQRQGTVGYQARQLFAPEALVTHPAFREIYHQDQVHLFEFDRQRCPSYAP